MVLALAGGSGLIAYVILWIVLDPAPADAASTAAPDTIAAQKLVRLYGRGLIEDNADLTGTGKKLAGCIPAVIREVVERSKLSAISRLKGAQDLVLTGKDLENAADGMLQHLKLIEPRPEDARSDREKAADRYGTHVGTALEQALKVIAPPTNGESKHVAIESVTNESHSFVE